MRERDNSNDNEWGSDGMDDDNDNVDAITSTMNAMMVAMMTSR